MSGTAKTDNDTDYKYARHQASTHDNNHIHIPLQLDTTIPLTALPTISPI